MCVEGGDVGTGRWEPDGRRGVVGRRKREHQRKEIMGWIVFVGVKTNGW